MVINEKALISQMKEAYKGGGYTVMVDDGVMYLTNGFWLADIDLDNVPGEIMGMFGQHIRKIPADGDAFRVTKTKLGPMVQHRILEEAMKSVTEMRTARADAYRAAPIEMRRTNLTYEGLQVWQASGGGDIYLIDPRYAAMIDRVKEVVKAGNGLLAEGETSRLWVLRCIKNEDHGYISHLEQMAWVNE